jgi:hypothetical protein
VEELKGIRRNGYFETAVNRGDGSDLPFGHAYLHVFHGFALFVDDSSFDGDALLCKDADGKKQERQQDSILHSSIV